MVNYLFPSVSSILKLERRCPHCNRPNGNIHSAINYRRISDIKVHAIAQRTMKCPRCKTTWTVRAEGISYGRQRSNRLISIGIFLYMLSLSYRNVEKFLRMMDLQGSKSSIEKEM